MDTYQLKSLNLPKLTGSMLKLFAFTVQNRFSRAFLINNLLENGGIPRFQKINLSEPPTLYPLKINNETQSISSHEFKVDRSSRKLPFKTSEDLVNGYNLKEISPELVTKKVLENIEQSDLGKSPLNTFIAIYRVDVLAQARASSLRYLQGRSLSPLDGVPVAVKDEIDMLPYPTTVGTGFLGKEPAKTDSTVVGRLRSAGAILIGKTNMHEIGINPNGSNVVHGAVRNPYHLDCDPGGSSSGSAAAVASGLVTAAIGADGGGSIRIPAALCGVVGLKPTFGRVSEFGAAPLCWSVAHLGPIAATVHDTALVYSVIAGPDPLDPNTLHQPAVTLEDWDRPDLKDIRIGIYGEWFEHATPEIVSSCLEMVESLKIAGAEVVDIIVPELDEMRVAHAVTILSEMALCMKPYQADRNKQGAAVRLSFVLGEVLTASDYLQAQRMRTRALSIFEEIYQKVDVILTPATAMTAQPIPPGGLTDGWSDLGTDTEMMRYVFPGNLAGLPAISFPVGYDSRGLPIGMQAMGRHWQENLLLRVAFNAEQVVERQTPQIYLPVI